MHRRFRSSLAWNSSDQEDGIFYCEDGQDHDLPGFLDVSSDVFFSDCSDQPPGCFGVDIEFGYWPKANSLWEDRVKVGCVSLPESAAKMLAEMILEAIGDKGA